MLVEGGEPLGDRCIGVAFIRTGCRRACKRDRWGSAENVVDVKVDLAGLIDVDTEAKNSNSHTPPPLPSCIHCLPHRHNAISYDCLFASYWCTASSPCWCHHTNINAGIILLKFVAATCTLHT